MCVCVCVLPFPAEEGPAPAKKPAFAFFGGGTRKITREPAAVAAAEPEEEAPAKPARKAFAFGTTRLSKQQAAAEVEEAEEEAPAPRKGGFRFGTSSSRAAQQEVAEPEEQAPPPRRVIRGRNPIAAEPEPAPARKQPTQADAAGEKKKSGGFLGLLGIQQETV